MNEMQKLISDYFDGQLTEEEGRQLRAFIAQSPENAREFMRASLLHNCLYEYITGAEPREELGMSEGVLPAMDVENPAPARPAPGWKIGGAGRRRMLIAAGILLPIGAVLLGFALNWGRIGPKSARPVAENARHGTVGTGEAVATLGRAIGAQWGGETLLSAGDGMAVGAFELRAGYAQVNFKSGASVVVHGPATFEMESPLKMRLIGGSLTTDVPPPAHGFTVEVPGASVVDLGTEVGVAVNGARESHVEVFKGQVEVQLAAANTARLLESAMAVDVNGDRGVFEEATSEPLAFTRSAELDGIEQGVNKSVRWQSMAASLRQDRDLVAWYSFANLYGSAGKLKNLAGATAGQFDGELQNVTWDAGRFPDRPAMHFHGAASRGLVNLSTPLESLTFAAWVKVHSFDHNFISLLMSDGSHQRPDLCHLQISKQGDRQSNFQTALQMSTTTPNGWDIYAFKSPTLKKPVETWHFVAVVVDRSKGPTGGAGATVSGYVDGVCVGTRPVAGNPPALTFGMAELGNWANAKAEDGRGLDGWMDDVALWKRPMKGEELRAIYEAGRGSDE